MKIAHLLPASATFPLTKHNGRYEWVLRLARMQTRAGHEVSIFAGSNSTDSSSILWRSLDSFSGDRSTQNKNLVTSALQDSSFDIFHSHFDFLGFSLANLTEKPVITTQHWFPTEHIAEKIRANTAPNAIAVPVTKYMKHANITLGIPSAEVIYHGIDLGLFHPDYSTQHRSDRLLYVGRVSDNKGVLEAVKLAHETGVCLDIIGKVNKSDTPYWESILPYINDESICYLGQKTQPELAKYLASAKALLFLPNGIEAFGQTIIEAQACGTPVITNDLGANKELVMHGQTGYILGHNQPLSDAIEALSEIDSAECASWANKFDINVMGNKYTELYQQLINGS